MPPAPKRQRLNGVRRRQLKRNATSNARWMHLSHAEVGFQSTIQTGIAVHCAVLGVLHYDLSFSTIDYYYFSDPSQQKYYCTADSRHVQMP